MSADTQFSYKNHWHKEEIILERSSGHHNDSTLGFSIAGGVDEPFIGPSFPFIIVIDITENGLAYQNKRLKLNDIILRVNDVDFTNIKHQQAIDSLKTAGQMIRLVIRRLSPPNCEELEWIHDGKLGIAIRGGIGCEDFENDPGIFVAEIDKEQTNKNLLVGDRLLQISSPFVSHNIAKEFIRLTCARGQKVKLYVGHVNKPSTALPDSNQETPCESQSQKTDHDHVESMTVIPKIADQCIENNKKQNFINPYDFYVHQRFENDIQMIRTRLLNDRKTMKSERLPTNTYATRPLTQELQSDCRKIDNSEKCNRVNQQRNFKKRPTNFDTNDQSKNYV
ncbi:hypothetical protein I4U23_023269 [Adineta vaga]|nr:hypothetical protein I4U23_023269 [Adineta vaga]